MNKLVTALATGFTVAAMVIPASPATAGEKRPVALTKCEDRLGVVAVVEGEARGWVDKKLESPVPVVEALAQSSGCFSVFDPASGTKADYLLKIVSGEQVEVAQATNLGNDRIATAAALAQNSGYNSGLGTVGAVAGMVPLAGAVINGAAGLVGIGRKKTLATGMSLVSTADSLALVAGTSLIQKTRLKFHDDDDDAMAMMAEGYWMGAVENASDSERYTKKEDGREMVHGLVLSFNNLVAQAQAIGLGLEAQAVAPIDLGEASGEAEFIPAVEMRMEGTVAGDPGAMEASPVVTVAIDSSLYLEPTRGAEVVRSIRPGMQLTQIGELSGIFLPVSDSYGVLGWVSVEDLE